MESKKRMRERKKADTQTERQTYIFCVHCIVPRRPVSVFDRICRVSCRRLVSHDQKQKSEHTNTTHDHICVHNSNRQMNTHTHTHTHTHTQTTYLAGGRSPALRHSRSDGGGTVGGISTDVATRNCNGTGRCCCLFVAKREFRDTEK